MKSLFTRPKMDLPEKETGKFTVWYRDRFLWLVLAIAGVILLPLLIEPLSFDSAINQTLGLDMVLRGRVPYVKIFDHGFPGSLYLQSFEILLFGSSDFGVRLFDFILQLAFAGFLYRFLLRWFPRKTALSASVLYTLFYISAGAGVYGERDVYVLMVVLISFALVSRDLSMWRIAVAGLLLGIACLLRPTSLLFLATSAAFVLVDETLRPSTKNIFRSILLILIGLIPAALFFLYLAQFPGGLQTFYDLSIRFNEDIYTKLKTPSNPAWEVFRSSPLILFAAYGMFARTSRGSIMTLNTKERAFYVIVLLLSILIVCIQQKFFRYHLMPSFILLVPPAAVAIQSLTEKFRDPIRRQYAIAGCFILCSLIRFDPTSSFAFGLALLTHQEPLQYVGEIRNADSLYGAKPEFTLLKYFSRNENAEGEVEICSLNPNLRLHLNRRYSSGYASLHTLAAKVPTSKNVPSHFTDYQKGWQKAYLDTLCKMHPRFIIVARQMKFWEVDDFNHFLRDLSGFDSLLRCVYRHDTTIGGFEVYKNVR